jgi:hypothetical protein
MDWELVDMLDDVLVAIVEVDCGEADVPAVLGFDFVAPPLLPHELVDVHDVDLLVELVAELDEPVEEIYVKFP